MKPDSKKQLKTGLEAVQGFENSMIVHNLIKFSKGDPFVDLFLKDKIKK